jgi:hypothetical protein
MTTDEEIITYWCKFFQEVAPMGKDSQTHAAIRLWRMAQDELYQKIKENPSGALKPIIAEARASEQDKAKAIQILAFEQGIAEGYNRGQADLIAKGWQILQSYNNTALWHSKHFLLMLIKASESAEAKGDEVERGKKDKVAQSSHAADNEPADSAPENACKHQWSKRYTNNFCRICGEDKPKETKPEKR